MSAGVEGHGTQQDQSGVYGDAVLGDGVRGLSHAEYKAGAVGINDNAGPSAGPGVYGNSRGSGVIGESSTWMGVYGRTDSTTGGAGVMGENTADGSGVAGHSVNGAGIYAKSDHGPAAVFDGKVEVRGDIEVTGDIRLQGSGDVAELFEARVPGATSPGTVVSVGEGGRIAPSADAYDRKVVGIVAGAGAFRPGLILEAGAREHGSPIAMVGKVYCRADASYGAIEVGDLLTTSPTEGHAMRVGDPARAFGAVVGKALERLDEGRGMIPVVVCLQ